MQRYYVAARGGISSYRGWCRYDHRGISGRLRHSVRLAVSDESRGLLLHSVDMPAMRSRRKTRITNSSHHSFYEDDGSGVEQCWSSDGTFRESERKDLAREFPCTGAEIHQELPATGEATSANLSLDGSQCVSGISRPYMKRAREESEVGQSKQAKSGVRF